MGKVNVTEVVSPVWGKCAKIENEQIELLVTLEFGPRVIHASRIGKENMMFEDLDRTPLGEKQDVFSETLKLCGGHRLWISPEILPRCYYPDSKPVEFEPTENGGIFTAPVEDYNFIQKSIQITLMEDEPSVSIAHTVKNCGAWDIYFAHWCITMLAPGGKEVIPVPVEKTGLLPNRVLTLWDYSDIGDPRVHWGNRYITLKQDSSMENAFKVGINSEAGWAAYFNRGQVFIKTFDTVPGGAYPDGGCSFETYTNGKMLECETLGEFVDLEPGDEATLYEHWDLYATDIVPSDDPDELDKLMEDFD
ncbi:MAG: DUF4380 domain-containing protein [Clostridiales bacterium]|jgi:hypothetical protein|nr:DUF4380 domain-containing protein [Clostridiales bacterium]MDR2749984.1 DUF4380 domain-containing protein [Clostridiales bacterium]